MTPLRQRMTEDMRLRNLGLSTQRAYLQYVAQFAGYFHRSPEMLGPAEIRAFQLHLSRDRQLSASSVGVAVAALRFLYKVTLQRGWNLDDVIPTGRQPQRLPAGMTLVLTPPMLLVCVAVGKARQQRLPGRGVIHHFPLHVKLTHHRSR